MLTKDSTPSTRPKSRLLLCAAAVSALSAFGCATDDVGVESETSDDLALLAPIGQQASTPNPEVPYIVDVKANGSGCPAGTWTTSVSPDGETFTTTFSAYEILLQPRQQLGVRDCILSLQMKSPAGISYAVSDFYYSGYAAPEVSSASSGTSGSRATPRRQREGTDLRGPIGSIVPGPVTTGDVVGRHAARIAASGKTRSPGACTSGNEEGYINRAALMETQG